METTPTGNIHGMPLSFLVKELAHSWTGITALQSWLKPRYEMSMNLKRIYIHYTYYSTFISIPFFKFITCPIYSMQYFHTQFITQ